ncbi:MAG TPA: hypothetical protein VMY88_08395 [Acidimicrobiales bacterium]|nr:hypothetical protein [Acidimicrobiales bacterium]
MDARQLIRFIGAGRTALGLIALTRPEVPARPWVGRAVASTPGGRVLARALGARDLVLGLGALISGSRGWAAAGAGADALDAAVTLGSFSDLPRRGRLLVLGSAGGAAIAGGLAAGVRAAP